MKALVVRPGPQFSTLDVHNGWVAGLRSCGVDVVEDAFDDRLDVYLATWFRGPDGFVQPFADVHDAASLAGHGILGSVLEVEPDVIVVIAGGLIPPRVFDVLRRRRHAVPIVAVMTESPYQDDMQIAMAGHVDIAVVNDPTHLAAFEAATDAYYQPACHLPALHHPREPDGPPVDFAFVGTGYPSRVAYLEQVDWTGIDAVLGGRWIELAPNSPLHPLVADGPASWPNDRTARLYARTRTSVNLYRRDGLNRPELEQGWAMGPREVELAACGTWFVRDPRGESDEVLGMLPALDPTDPATLGDHLRWALAHPHARAKAAAAAQEAVHDRTFHHAAARLLQRLDRRPVQTPT